MSAPYITDRERLEGSLSGEQLQLADGFAEELNRLGHHDFASRRALLLALAAIVDTHPKGQDLGLGS